MRRAAWSPTRRAFLFCRRAVAGVEFAIIAPALIVMLCASFDAANAEAIYVKLRAATSALSTMTIHSTTLQTSDVAELLGVAGLILAPYSSAPLNETISQIAIDASGNATVQWSAGAAPLSVGSAISLPAAFDTPNSYTIFVQGNYLFTPMFSFFAPGGITLTDTLYATPSALQCINFPSQGVTGCNALQ